MRAPVLSVAACLLSGCIHTVNGPGYAPRVDGETALAPVRVVYAGRHYEEPEDFVPRLEDALSRELGQRVAVERSEEAQSPGVTAWPPAIAGPRDGGLTVLIRAERRVRCGTGPAAMGALSVLTAGLVPYLDARAVPWIVETFAGPERHIGRFEFDVEGHDYGWLPLVPLVPLNLGWRWLHGGEHDYFVRVFPSHLHAELLADAGASAPIAAKGDE
jgi:hypothetical protein